MIIDKIENIDIYNNISKSVKEFLKNCNKDISLGKLDLENGIFVNIEEYKPKSKEDAKFESHKEYIDIQLLLKGFESIYVNQINSLTEANPYDPQKDIVFYKEKINDSFRIDLDGSNFVMLYPHEAHAPQVELNKTDFVKKVVVKIPINSQPLS